MKAWRIHWLEAEGDLRDWRLPIAAGIEAAQRAVTGLLRPPRLDILVQRRSGEVIPEIGMVGFAHRKSLFSLSVDPENPNFARCLTDGTLARQVVHEVHHCLRMASAGYGRSLGEALVSEGLAGQFVGMLFASPPEPWERAVDLRTLRDNLPDEAELSSTGYDHAAWFFGTDKVRPRWLGYTLGYEIVGHWLAKSFPADASAWVDVPAQAVLAEGLPRFKVAV